jgi:hypothetical protein
LPPAVQVDREKEESDHAAQHESYFGHPCGQLADLMDQDQNSVKSASSDNRHVHTLAKKLAAMAETLPGEERAMLEHVLLAALSPHERYRLSPPDDLLSEAESGMLDRLARFEE